ncbi:MAG: hypothetical protein D6687_00585 [Acidobacteria bacterium]|nr:MAG: hypothetical protein D6687_00585 [Acidobacteriota bacterium]
MPKKKKDSVDPSLDLLDKFLDGLAYSSRARMQGERDAKERRPPSFFAFDPRYKIFKSTYMDAYNAAKRAQQQNLRQSQNLTIYTYDHNCDKPGFLMIPFYTFIFLYSLYYFIYYRDIVGGRSGRCFYYNLFYCW